VNKGFAYTSFAVMAAGLIMMIAALQVSGPHETNSAEGERIGEAAFFLDSALSDADRTLEMATRRAFTANTNYVVTEGEPLQQAEQNMSEALVNGTMDGEPLDGTENASINDWNNRVSEIASGSGYELGITLEDYDFEENGLDLESSFTVFTVLEDPVTLASFNRTESKQSSTSLEDVEDPLITLRSEGRYVSQYEECRLESPAEKISEGQQRSQNSAKGEAAKQIDEEQENKVFVTDDIDDYEPSEVEDYEAIVSEQISEQPDSYNDNYIYGVEINVIEEGDKLLLNKEQLWISVFTEMFQENCYMETDTAPTVLDRLENRLISAEEESGITTFLDVSQLPDELQTEGSAVDYVYFNESSDYGSLNEIVEVSDRYSWFRIDDYHVDYWDLEDLVE